MKLTFEMGRGGDNLYEDFVVADFAGEVAELHLELVRGPVLVPDESQIIDFNSCLMKVNLLTLSRA